MKRRVWSALLACLMILSLAACGEKAPDPSQGTEDTSASTQERPDTAPEPLPTPARPAVEGNGGYFVRLDDKVWFRRYDDGTLDESRLWGEFLSAYPTHAVTSTLCYYDEASGAVVEAMKDDGFGELWFGVDGFYLTRVTGEDSREAYFKTLDGTETVLGEGIVAGVSDNGRFAAVQNNNTFWVYDGTKGNRALSEESGICNFCAVTDEGEMVYYAHDASSGESRLTYLDADDHIKDLGVLPDLPEGISSYGWEFEQCLLDGNDVWCTFGAYEGTGHFLADALVVRAKLDTPDSLEAIEDEATTEYPFVPKLWRAETGGVMRAEHAPGELEISYENGDLIWYESADEGTALIASFLPQNDYSDDSLIEQGMEALGDAAYIIVAEASRDPDNDIGWRIAYAPGELHYLRVPLHADADAEPLDGKLWESAPAAADVYAAYVGAWALTATEVEGDRSDTLPEGVFETLEFREDGTAVINGTEYKNSFSSMELLPTNGADENASPYGLLFTSAENEDMLWVYFEGETLVGTTMIHFEVDGGTDSYSRTGFYERSEG